MYFTSQGTIKWKLGACSWQVRDSRFVALNLTELTLRSGSPSKHVPGHVHADHTIQADFATSGSPSFRPPYGVSCYPHAGTPYPVGRYERRLSAVVQLLPTPQLPRRLKITVPLALLTHTVYPNICILDLHLGTLCIC